MRRRESYLTLTSSTVGWKAFVVTTYIGWTSLSVSRSDSASWSTSVYTTWHRHLSELCRQTRNIEGCPQLRSATRGDLDVPRCRLSTYGRRVFSCSGPAPWNSLPARLKNSALTIEQFRRLLKSIFFLATSASAWSAFEILWLCAI